MTHITEERVIGNHAAMGKSPPAAPDTPFLTLENIFRAGARRAARRREILAAQSTWDSESRDEASGAEGFTRGAAQDVVQGPPRVAVRRPRAPAPRPHR
jgi:hypothetical protein